MDFTYVLFGVLFIAGGVLFAKGKLLWYLSDFRRMPDNESDRTRISSHCLNVGELIALNGLIFLLKGIFSGFTASAFTIAIAAWMIVACFDIWHISKNTKVHK